MNHYVYKITFVDMPWFYYGVHTENGRNYMGSPKTHKWIWDFYEPKKEIVQYFETREEADAIEKRIIDYHLSNKNCLNECSGGKFSLDSLRRGALKRNSLPISEKTKQKQSKKSKENWQNPTIACKMKHGLQKATKNAFTVEAKNKRSNSVKKTFKEINHQQGPKNSQFGTKWITNGFINLKIKKEDPLPEGFSYGRIKKLAGVA
jgi:hypothetical protein